MRNYSDIRILDGVLHLINPRSNHLGISTKRLELSNDVDAFLCAHVKNGLQDSKAVAAKFVRIGLGSVRECCLQMLASPSDFVGRSGDLARSLYAVSALDLRIKDATVAILSCESESQSFLSIIKLDPSSGFRPIENRSGSGEIDIQLSVQEDILPSIHERVQKAAFIRVGNDLEYDMLLVDRQRPADTISHYFVDDFLGAEEVLDAKRRTELLCIALRNAQNRISDALTPDVRTRLDNFIGGQVVSEHVNLDELILGLPINETLKDQFAIELDRVLPDRDFELDAGSATRFLRKKRFKGDNGLMLTAPGQFFDEMVRVTPPSDDGDGKYTIEIKTGVWQAT